MVVVLHYNNVFALVNPVVNLFLHHQVKNFARLVPSSSSSGAQQSTKKKIPQIKMVILDEADNMTNAAQVLHMLIINIYCIYIF